MFSGAQMIAEGEQWAGHASGCDGHDDQHGEDARRQNPQVITDVERDQFHQPTRIHQCAERE